MAGMTTRAVEEKTTTKVVAQMPLQTQKERRRTGWRRRAPNQPQNGMVAAITDTALRLSPRKTANTASEITNSCTGERG